MSQTKQVSRVRQTSVAVGLWLVFCVPMALLLYLWSGAAWQMEQQAAGRASTIHLTSPPVLWAAVGLFGVPVLFGCLALVDRLRARSRKGAT